MGSFLKTSVVVGFLLLLPALVHGDRFLQVNNYVDKNCTVVPQYVNPGNIGISVYNDFNRTADPVTFHPNPGNLSQTFESAKLVNFSGNVLSLVACQAGLACDATEAIQISFNLSDIGACSTAGPAGTQFDKFLLS